MKKKPPPAPPPAESAKPVTPPEQIYGRILTGLANALGIHPQDAALMATSILGNVAGPKAAVLDLTGRRVEAGFNLIWLGDPTARFQALLDRLMEPVRTSQAWIRKAVSGCSRPLVAMWDFGLVRPDKNARWADAHDEMASRHHRQEHRDWTKAMLEKGLGLPDQTQKVFDPYEGIVPKVRDPGPGAFHLPSFLLEGLGVDGIAEALGEVHSRRAFVFDPAGRLWQPTPGINGATVLADLLRGQDRRFGSVHPNQGFGSHGYAKIGVLSTLPMDRLGRLVSEPLDPQADALKHCLLIKPRTVAPSLPVDTPSLDACTRYSRVVTRTVTQRMSDADSVYYSLSKAAGSMVARFQKEIFQRCENNEGVLSRHTAHLHDLACRVLWALLELREGDPPREIIRGAFLIAYEAIQRHVHLLAAAKTQWEDALKVEPVPRVLRRAVKRTLPSRRRTSSSLPIPVRKR